MKKLTLVSIYLVLTAGLLIFPQSCKKDNKNDTQPPDNQGTPTLTALKTNVMVYELISLKANSMTLNQSSYNGTVGSLAVKIAKVNDTLMVFMMPDVAGSVSLQTTIEGHSFTLGFTSQQGPAISNPSGYINTFVNSFNIPIDPQYQNCRDSINLYFNKFNSLSTQEKMQTAEFIQANRANLDIINSSINQASASLDSVKCNKYKSKQEKNPAQIIEDITTPIEISIMKIGLVAGSSGFLVYAAAASSVALAPAAVAVGVGLCVGIAAYEVYKDVPIITKSINQSINSVEAKFLSNKSNQYNNNSAANISCKITRENIQDKTYPEPWLNNFVKSVKSFDHLWTENYWSTYLNGINPPNFPAEATQDGNTYDMSNLTLVITNNNNVTGQLGGTVDNLTVTFSTSETTTQNFQFKIIYNDGVFTTETPVVDGTLNIAPLTNVINVSFDGQSYSLSSNIIFENMNSILTLFGRLDPNTPPAFEINLYNFTGVGNYNLSCTLSFSADTTNHSTILFSPDDWVSTDYYNNYHNYNNNTTTYTGNINITLSTPTRIVGTANAILYQDEMTVPKSLSATFDLHK